MVLLLWGSQEALPMPLTTDIAYDRTVDHWCRLGWELDDQGWHAPEGWQDFWGNPNEDFWVGDAEFARIRSQIDGI